MNVFAAIEGDWEIGADFCESQRRGLGSTSATHVSPAEFFCPLEFQLSISRKSTVRANGAPVHR